MKRLLSKIIVFCMLVSMASAASAEKNLFIDVNETAWYFADVISAVEMKIVSGKTANEFKPDDNLTYAEALKLAACMNQYSIDGKVTLANGSPWYQSYYEYCIDKEIVSADENIAFNENATRLGYMKIFAKALPDECLNKINDVADNAIPDVKTGSDGADSVYKLYRAGILAGVDDKHTCNPEANIKRSEVAAIISRMMDSEKRVKFTLNENDISETVNSNDIVNVVPTQTIGHEHIYKLAQNDYLHWEECIECDEYKNAEEHVFKSGKCTVCGFEEGENKEKLENNGYIEIPVVNNTQIVQNPTVEYDPKHEGNYTVDIADVYIEKNPISVETQGYTVPGILEVKVNGGVRPYTYQWKYRSGRDTYDIVDTESVRGANTDKLTVYANSNDKYTGATVYCTVTDANGKSVNSGTAAVYGPFQMKVDSWSIIGGSKYSLVGRLSDGLLKHGEKLSVERNGKIIAFGIVEDIQMFNKSLDEAVKNDNIGITFSLTDGYIPGTGDTVIRYQDYHEIDGSDIIN